MEALCLFETFPRVWQTYSLVVSNLGIPHLWLGNLTTESVSLPWHVAYFELMYIVVLMFSCVAVGILVILNWTARQRLCRVLSLVFLDPRVGRCVLCCLFFWIKSSALWSAVYLTICVCSYDKPFLLLLSMDGFHVDYLARKRTPTLQALIDCGVRAEYMRSVFPTRTFPNQYAITTVGIPLHRIRACLLRRAGLEK